MAINPLFIFLALLACAVLISAADLYKVLDCAYDALCRRLNRVLDFILVMQWISLRQNKT